MIEAVIFDLDGVLLDSEKLWDRARREVAQRAGGTWLPGSTEAMQGMSSTEWPAYLRDRLGVQLSAEQINTQVIDRLLMLYQEALPLLPGAREAVERMAAAWPLGLASSSNRSVIDVVLDRAHLGQFFSVTVSSEEVPRGKPAPDVYLEAARRLGVTPSSCAVVEDSANGIRAGVAARMRVVAIPNSDFPPPDEVLAMAQVVLPSLRALTPDVVVQRAVGRAFPTDRPEGAT
jgi:HAD superfamily hydrolase (TIGR01509 family)